MNSNKNMAVWNDNSWRPLTEFRREMDRLIDDLWSPSTSRGGESQFIPACEVEEEENHYLLAVEMPGISKDDVKVEVLENQITISGERKQETKSKNGGWYSERRFGKFQRSFTLPAGIDAGRIEADYRDGILRLMVPKAESAKPRQIKIGSGSSGGFFGKLLGQSDNKVA